MDSSFESLMLAKKISAVEEKVVKFAGDVPGGDGGYPSPFGFYPYLGGRIRPG